MSEEQKQDHPCHFVFAGMVKEGADAGKELWRCSSPGCGKEETRDG